MGKSHKTLYEYFSVECKGKDVDEVANWYIGGGWSWDNCCVFVSDWYEDLSKRVTLYFCREKLKQHPKYPITNQGESTHFRSWYPGRRD